jgi:hypothetical protein
MCEHKYVILWRLLFSCDLKNERLNANTRPYMVRVKETCFLRTQKGACLHRTINPRYDTG